MRTINEVAKQAGVSIRTLQYYDRIGLLVPRERTAAGYRLYDEDDLARLQQILLFRELEFPLKEIRQIMDSPAYDARRALEQQVRLLELKQERVAGILQLARNTLTTKGKTVDFTAFDSQKLDEYARQAKESWGDTPQWKEYEEKGKGRSKEEERDLGKQLMELFVPFGGMLDADPACPEAQAQVSAIQDFISAHFYQCSDEMLAQLGAAYGAGGEFTRNIDAVAGEGAAVFAARAIEARTQA